MDMTWRLERPEAITTASQSEERPSRLMVTISSALSSSSEVLTRRSKSVSGAGLARTGAGFGAGFGPAFFAGFFPGFFPGLLRMVFLAGFLAVAALRAAGFLALAFRDGLMMQRSSNDGMT